MEYNTPNFQGQTEPIVQNVSVWWEMRSGSENGKVYLTEAFFRDIIGTELPEITEGRIEINEAAEKFGKKVWMIR